MKISNYRTARNSVSRRSAKRTGESLTTRQNDGRRQGAITGKSFPKLILYVTIRRASTIKFMASTIIWWLRDFLSDALRNSALFSIKSVSWHNWIFQSSEDWEGSFRSALGDYEKLLYDAYRKGQFDNAELKKTWTFFNAMFFCGTIYTTIGESTTFWLEDLTHLNQNWFRMKVLEKFFSNSKWHFTQGPFSQKRQI